MQFGCEQTSLLGMGQGEGMLRLHDSPLVVPREMRKEARTVVISWSFYFLGAGNDTQQPLPMLEEVLVVGLGIGCQ